ncbi:hypothetical protein T459_28662 [Capsicum annuum]|uniref:Fatty acyl-CoA reductase n=1 Tax=Capsicum annuum TaxID=4072 RepID=A0A2G2YHH7_CAPAN|nr:hypothetical protein T459_28662 [Capsicum annuum]
MKDEMLKEIDIVRHSAATTRFDERYHIAMNINVLGAANVLKFAKRCANVKILVHVSTGHYFYVSLTSYVCGEREREEVIQEKSFNFEDSYIDIDVERKVIEDKLKDLEAQNLSSKEVTMAMRDLGIQRFDDCNTERLRMTMKEYKMDDVLNFNPSCINWEDYLLHTHIPGL